VENIYSLYQGISGCVVFYSSPSHLLGIIHQAASSIYPSLLHPILQEHVATAGPGTV
jgi:hypothetical protein